MLGLKGLLGLQKRCEGIRELFRGLKVGRECVQSRYFGSLVCPPLHSLTMSQAALIFIGLWVIVMLKLESHCLGCYLPNSRSCSDNLLSTNNINIEALIMISKLSQGE